MSWRGPRPVIRAAGAVDSWCRREAIASVAHLRFGHNRTMTQTSCPSAAAQDRFPPGVPDPRRCVQEGVSSSGVTFRSCNDLQYISINYHRSPSGTTHPKSIWNISRPDECHYFCSGNILPWKDEDGNCWSIGRDAREVLGTRGERVAFYQQPVNQVDPWHGFPVGGRRTMPMRRRPPDELLRQWLDSGWISQVTYDRLLGGRL